MINVVDLFSGAGGLTFGFQKKIVRNRFVDDDRFNVIFANEYEKNAAYTFKMNFPGVPMIQEDIGELDLVYLQQMYLDISNVDIVIGGPPCQSYSTVGKRQYDNRARMYREYRRMLSILQPKLFIFENVLGLLTMKNDLGLPVIDDVVKSFNDFSEFNGAIGYTVQKKVLNAQDFGVPQSRERVFLVGVRKDLNLERDWCFPTAGAMQKHVSVGDAIGDLPELVNGAGTNHYTKHPYTKYQFLMRGNQKVLKNHVNGVNGRKILKIMEVVPEGEGRPYINQLVQKGKLAQEFYLTSGYGNSYGRLWWNRPSTTITNNLSTPSSLRCIHPKQNRALTSREGARLQSFPDNFIFYGSKEQVNSQIGNAVPPLLSMHLANSVIDFFESNKFIRQEG
ncbi:DNA cytosine methyltransferase [Lactiplantibacillus pentosus]